MDWTRIDLVYDRVVNIEPVCIYQHIQYTFSIHKQGHMHSVSQVDPSNPFLDCLALTESGEIIHNGVMKRLNI